MKMILSSAEPHTIEDPKLSFRRLHKRALALGLKPKDLRQLQSLHNLKTTNKWLTLLYRLLLILFLVIIVTLSCIFLSFPFSDIWVISLLAQVFGTGNAQCILDNRDILQDLFQRPINCSICHGVTEITTVSNLTPEEFEHKYAYSGIPVVVTDAMVNWTAPVIFTFEYFRDIYTEDSTKVRQNCQFFPYKTKFKDLHEVFSMNEDRARMVPGFDPWYIGWSNCDPMVANNLRKHYSRPYFLPRQSESSKTDWIFMGTPGFGAHLHIDNVHNPSWQAQVRGHKKWILEPPPECYDVCAPRMETTLTPGDIIMVDTNRWYHSTFVIGDDISICIGSEYD